MKTYYIDPKNGNNNNDGLSEYKPLKNIDKISLYAGDTVLFKCGSFMRAPLLNVSGEDGAPITYGSYGEGEKPIFCGSADLANEELWEETENNIWMCDKVKYETGNIIFENSYGTLRWSMDELKNQGDFFDDRFGATAKNNKADELHILYMYSKGNPGKKYNKIEAATGRYRQLAETGHDMIFENLCFINNGIHAIAGEAGCKNITVRNCEFHNIGGCVWTCKDKVRFGNGFEAWNIAENIEVTECVFDNIYDSAVTHQGNDDCKPADNFIIENNTFNCCGMAAYEQRDMLPKFVKFNNNTCIDAGEGFSKQGEIMPRFSEIWPQPMGHHVFLWRIEKPTENADFEIKNNTFMDAPYGSAIYSIINSKAEEQINICNNDYKMKRFNELNRFSNAQKVELKCAE